LTPEDKAAFMTRVLDDARDPGKNASALTTVIAAILSTETNFIGTSWAPPKTLALRGLI
jgi:hypothetical protein